MKKSELKKRLRAESRIFVPDINLPFIQKPIEERRKTGGFSFRKLALIFSVLILSVVSLVLLLATTSQQPSLLVIDINPSFEIELKGEEVLEVRPLNLDAAYVLEEAGPLGRNLDETLDAILRKTHELGYLEDPSQTIEFLTVSSRQGAENRLNNKIKAKISAVLQNNSLNFGLKNGNENPGLKIEAKKNRISTGKMALIKKAIATEKLTLKEALKLSPRELNDLRKDYREEELAEFRNKYREKKEAIKTEIENTLKAKTEKSQEIREKLKAYKKELESNPDFAVKKKIHDYLNDNFPGYDFKSPLTDLKGRLDELLKDEEALDHFFDEAISEILEVEFSRFQSEIREKLKEKDFNFEFEFQKELALDELIKKYRTGLSGREIKVYTLAEQIYALASKNQDRFDPNIEVLYRQYRKNLEMTDESFRNSEYIQEFERFYKEYSNKN